MISTAYSNNNKKTDTPRVANINLHLPSIQLEEVIFELFQMFTQSFLFSNDSLLLDLELSSKQTNNSIISTYKYQCNR